MHDGLAGAIREGERMTSRQSVLVAALLVGMLCAHAAEVSAQCVGDCNADGEVTVNEIIVGVSIALGTQGVSACSASDADGNEQVTVDEIVRAINAALLQCRATINGICLAPGDVGLVRCQPGRRVRVLRCDDVTQCLSAASARTLLGEAILQEDGRFSIEFSAQTMGRPLIYEAVVDAASTTFRVIDFGLASGGGRGRTPRGVGAAAADHTDVVIDPSSEGAVQALDLAGLQNVTDPVASLLTDGVRREAALGQAYAGLSSPAAIVAGAAIAADVLFVAPQRLVVSPEGTEVYAISSHDRAIVRLVREPIGGSLRIAQIIGSAAASSQLAFERPLDLVLSSDEANAYVVDNGAFTSGALFVFSRDTTLATHDLVLADTLPFKLGALAVPRRPTAAVVNPDGQQVFVASLSDQHTSAVTVFDRDAAGDLSLPRTFSGGTIEDPDGIEIALAPFDARHLYVLTEGGGRVASEIRAFSQEDGNLSVVQTQQTSADVSAYGLTLSPDGRDAYLVESSGGFAEASDMVRQFARDGSSGTLALRGATGVEGRIASLAVSPDGAHVYAAGVEYNADLEAGQTAITTLQRVPETGQLSLLHSDVVVTSDRPEGESGALSLDASVAVSRDGTNVYVSNPNDNAIAMFERAPATGELRSQKLLRIPAQRLPTPPLADQCGSAVVIQGFPFAEVLDTAAASVSEDDPLLSCGAEGQQGHSVWYRFVAPGTGVVTLSTIGSSYDTVLAVHTGSCGGFDEVACSDDHLGYAFSALRVAVEAGRQYSVEVTNFGVRPAGLLLFRGQFGRRLCEPCASSDDCEGGTCFRCSATCAADAPLRCGTRGTPADCEDGTY